MTTTLWDFPYRSYGGRNQGSPHYRGSTPSYVIWNLLARHTRPNDLALDPMCGSGTTLDVAAEMKRQAIGFDLVRTRPEIGVADARSLPLQSASVDFVFVDPPYSDQLRYSEDRRCIGRLNAGSSEYYRAMGLVMDEIHRVLKPGRRMALYVSDSLDRERFHPIGFELFFLLKKRLTPVRHHRGRSTQPRHKAAATKLS